MNAKKHVYVVDDDAGMRDSLTMLLIAENFQVETFDSANAFLKICAAGMSGCLILDLKMPGMSGLELQEHLTSVGIELPVIFITAHGDVPTAVRAMKSGSFDFIEKPYSTQLLLESVYKAIQVDCENRAEKSWRYQAQEKMKLLTEREREILILVVQGKPSKLIAELLNLSVSTVDNHRAKIMKKLDAETTADLTRIALIANPNLVNYSI
ncbi:MAG TPA: response regulator [Bacteriovoracaceae bacterium]|nr:response regulator [Bacteriovoracaceae bacterium]